jgi:transmembrane sensor
MNTERSIQSNPQIAEEAAEWLVEFRSGDIDSGGRRGFDAWLRASPEHLRAFIEMAALWQESGSIDPERKVSIEDLIVRAQAESNVLDFDHPAARERPLHAVAEPTSNTSFTVSTCKAERPVRRGYRVTAVFAAAAMVVIGLVAALLFAGLQLHKRPVYATEVGEQRSIRLMDGSTVILDSRSQLRVAFDDSVRAVDLLQGRALFRVAKNPSRPFIVRADATMVRAVGTQFDVNKNTSATIVTVVEGRVALFQRTAGGGNGSDRIETGNHPLALLSAGEQIRITTGQTGAQPTRANVGSATAWTEGRLVLESASLAEVAEEFNRYSRRKLVASDHGATPLRLSGVFVTDPDFFIRYLRARPDIVVHETGTEIDIVRKDPE